MKRILLLTALVAVCVLSYAQRMNVLDEIKANPQKSYGTDYPYTFDAPALTKSPKGYKPFYISHYARHGSRYYWNNSLYLELDTIMTEAHEKHLLTPDGEKFYEQYKALYPEFMAGMGELTHVGWDQHQGIARKMYESFPEVFKKGGTVRAISSTTGRCIISMSAFCQAMVQCNPKIDIYEQASRATLHGVKPDADDNPYRKQAPRARAELDMTGFNPETPQVASNDEIVARLFTSTEGLSRSSRRIYSNLKNLYTSLPSIGHEELLVGLFKPEELTANWERNNLNSYRNWYRDINVMKPIVQDILDQAKLVIDGECNDIASLRFGHDTNLGPLNIVMGINMPKGGVTDASQLKYYFQDFQIGKAGNLQFIFYKSKKNPEILVKCLQNGYEVQLPLDTDCYPYYKWTDFYNYYSAVCAE